MQTLKTTRQKQNKQNIQLIQLEPERYLFAVEWWAGGCPVFCFIIEGFLFSLFFVCFCLVFLSVCMYRRTTLVATTTTTTKPSRKTQKQKYSSSSRNLRHIYSRPSGGLDVLFSFLFFCYSRIFLFVFLEGLLFLPSLFKLLPEHNTIHYTKHKQTLVSNVQRFPNIRAVLQHTIKTWFRVCFCIIVHKCDRFACTP